MGDEADAMRDALEEQAYLHMTGQCGGDWDCDICRADSRWEFREEALRRRLRARARRKWPGKKRRSKK